MQLLDTMYPLICTLAFVIVAACPSYGDFKQSPGALVSSPEPDRASFKVMDRQARQYDEGSMSLDRAWFNEVLFSYGADQTLQQTHPSRLENEAGISVTCNTCYIKGTAIARISADDDFDASQEFQKVMSQVSDEISNLTESVKDAVIEFLGDDEEHAFMIDNDFNIDLPELPKCHLQFQFDGMELYMDLDASFFDATTYTLNLYTSETPVGLSIANQDIGVFIAIDLVLGVEGQIDINSGFHIRLNDGLQIDIGLFEREAASITMTGGDFEFLPVTLKSASVTMKAALRLGIYTGLAIDIPDLMNGSVGAGAEAGVFANIAEFITKVDVNLDGDRDDDDKCDLSAVQEYQIAVGAAAGASVFIDRFTWGPTPETEVPIWGTTLAQVCATSHTTTAAPALPTSAFEPRGVFDAFDEDVSTYTVVGCRTPGLSQCPVSAQTTFTATTTTTVPTSAQSAAIAAIPFGTNAKALTVTAGKPSSFVPTPTATAHGNGTADGTEIAHVSDHNAKIIIGLSVGLGVPFLIAVLAGALYLLRRDKNGKQPRSETFSSTCGAGANTKAI